MSTLPEAAPHSRLKYWTVFPIGRTICKIIVTLLGRARVRGAYRVPKNGPILVLPNHRADADPVLVQAACPRFLHFMGKSELFEMPLVGSVLRLVDAFPVKRGEPDRAALRRAAELLKIGEAVCVFPEGQLTETGDLQEIKPGVALIIRMSGAPVICLGLKNTDRMMPYGSVIPRPTSAKVSAMWGEVRSFNKEDSVEEITGWVAGQLRELTSD
jgi:1-acyl-sn-glycerol-3-phosphate acyltransferase